MPEVASVHSPLCAADISAGWRIHWRTGRKIPANRHIRNGLENRRATASTENLKLVLELVLISANLPARKRTEAGPNPRLSPRMDLS
jgi:hypothetical protein